MSMPIFFKDSKGDPYRITLVDDSIETLDELLDQMSVIKIKDISEQDFLKDCFDPMTIDLMDKSGNLKLGEMMCLNIYRKPLPTPPNT